jgi:hypothetical protein
VTKQPTRTVTLLFTDIGGSTRLLDRLGAERYGEALDLHRWLAPGGLRPPRWLRGRLREPMKTRLIIILFGLVALAALLAPIASAGG